jgi:hypothetical protein
MSESHEGPSLMRVFVTCVLIAGPAVLLIVGFLSVVHDLLSRSIFAGPMSPTEEHGADTSEEARFSGRGAPTVF